MHVSTFAVNYRGHPFMQSLWENKPLLYCLAIVGGITALAASQILPEFTETLELVPFDNEVCFHFLKLNSNFLTVPFFITTV